MPTLDELTTPLTVDQVRSSIYSVCAAVGLSTTTWKPGAWPRTVITGVSILGAAWSTLNAKLARMRFLDYAEGDWLTLKALHDYAVTKQTATFATGKITLVNSSGGVYNLNPRDLIIHNPTTKKTYRNTQAIALAALSTLTDVPIIAEEAGAASTSAPNTITAFTTPLNGVTVTNPVSVVGLDAESDPSLRTKCSEKLGSVSPNGPWDAYTYQAKNAKRADGTSIGVTRVRVSKDGLGNVTVYIATATGAVSGSSSDVNTDLGAVHDALQRKATPLAITENTVSASALAIAVTYQLWMYNTPSLTNQQVIDLVAARLTEFMSAEPIGGDVIGVDSGKVFQSAIAAAIGSTRTAAGVQLPIFKVVVTVPTGDTTLSLGQVPVLGSVTPTINQVSAPEGF